MRTEYDEEPTDTPQAPRKKTKKERRQAAAKQRASRMCVPCGHKAGEHVRLAGSHRGKTFCHACYMTCDAIRD